MGTQTGRRYEDGLGGSITILEEGSETRPMRFRMVMPPNFGPPAPERHPRQREEFRVLRGRFSLGKVDGRDVVLGAGETFTLPAGTYHLPRNAGEEELEFEATLTPGLEMAEMFAKIYTESKAHEGLSQFARVAMVFREYRESIEFPAPVRAVMAVVAGLGRLFGVRLTPIGELPAPDQSVPVAAE